MGRYASDSGGNFQQPPTGTHVARCVKLIDLGTQHGQYQGKPNIRNQVLFMFELPNEPMDDGKPFVVTKFYTNSLGEKANLRQDLESWRGKAFSEAELAQFDLEKILGVPCMVSIVEKKEKHVIASISAIPKGMTCPKQINPSFTFWIDEWVQEEFDSLSDGIKNIIHQSDEYKKRGNGKTVFSDMKDDLPWQDDVDERNPPPF